MFFRALTIGAVAVVLVASLATPAVAATAADEYDEPALVVELDGEGDATTTLISAYDLESDAEREAFEEIRDDTETRAELEDRFVDRMASVADGVDASVDRDVSVTAGSVDVRIEGDHGIVAVSVEWTGLAAAEDDRLVVTEPFASGYEPDRTLVVVGPEGSTIESATPDPTAQADGSGTWAAGTDLADFEATFALETDAGDAGDDAFGLPGFGALAATLALGVVLAVVATIARRGP